METACDMSEEMDLMEARMGVEHPIRPCQVFNLDYQTLASSYGLLVTYSIVLIQAKTGEQANM